MKLLTVVLLSNIFIERYVCKKEYWSHLYGDGDVWTSIISPEKFGDSHKFSVYLGYTNNPFGPSTRVQNASTVYTSLDNSLTEDQSYLNIYKNRLKFAHTKDNDVADFGYDKINMREQRSKRGVLHLYNMVSCATGCNPLIYKGYGCYCGFLGSGYAVDGIDRCCKMHDWCYDQAKCPMYLEYFVPYLWKCYYNRPLCAIRYGPWGQAGLCAQRLCECDRILSECLRKYPCPSSRAICKSSSWRFLQNALMFF